MKKIYLSLLTLTVTVGINSQTIKHQNHPAAGKNTTLSIEKVKPSTVIKEKGMSLWSDDFSNGANWSFANTSSPAYGWSIVTDPTLIPVVALRPAAFTSVDNGYAFINSDAQGGTATQNADITLTVPFSTLGNPNVSIVFENTYRTYQDKRIVRVSNDAGANWTDFTVTDGTETGINTNNPTSVNINISSVAGNQAAVLIQFHYEATWGWYWAIDDVSVNVTDDYDLSELSVIAGVTGPYATQMFYSQTPMNQVQPVNFSARAQNIGVMQQTDAIYTASIASASYTGTSLPITLDPNQIDTLDAVQAFTPPASLATYTVNSVVSSTLNGASELNLLNNTIPDFTLEVTNDIYARDKGTIVSGSYNQGLSFEVGNVFDIFTDDVLYGVDVVLGTGAVVDAVFFATFYEIDPANGSFINGIRTTDRILAAGEPGTKVSLTFDAPIPVTGGNAYVVTVGSDGGAGDDLIVATSGTSLPQTSHFLDETLTWFYTTSTPMVRMNFNASLALNELDHKVGMNIFPNPSNGNVNVTFNLQSQKEVSIIVTDLAGKVALTNEMGTLNLGAHKVTLNTESLSNGVYMVNIIANGVSSIEKLVVRK
jgi:hypothetical protein